MSNSRDDFSSRTVSSTEFYEYECGCWYEHVVRAGETISLRLVTCSMCMDTAMLNIERAQACATAQQTLDLT